MEFKLGSKLRDTVTGFEGIATAKITYLNGCIQYCVKPKVTKAKSDTMPEGQYIDAQQLELVDKGISIKQKVGGGVMMDTPKGH
jgi:hypothetical protein